MKPHLHPLPVGQLAWYASYRDVVEVRGVSGIRRRRGSLLTIYNVRMAIAAGPVFQASHEELHPITTEEEALWRLT